MTIGLTASIHRGGKAIGMQTPCDLSVSVLVLAAEKHPDCKRFRLRVNQFGIEQAQRIADAFDVYGIPDSGIRFDVQSSPGLGQDAYLIEPVE